MNMVKHTWEWFLCSVPDNRMVCNGDSGGPLVCQGILFGITSHGYNYYPGISNLTIKCGDNRAQTRYIFILKYRQWIDNIINGTSNTMECYYLIVGFIIWLIFYKELLQYN